MKVSGGTYVRSLAHDIGLAIGSAAHVVTLTRLRQGEFTLEPDGGADKECVPWEVFQEAARENEEPEEKVQRDEMGYRKWESEVLKKLVLFEDNQGGLEAPPGTGMAMDADKPISKLSFSNKVK